MSMSFRAVTWSVWMVVGCSAPSGGGADVQPVEDAVGGADGGMDGGADGPDVGLGDDVAPSLDRTDVGMSPEASPADRPMSDVGTDATTCADGQAVCASTCVAVASDPMNCGACGRMCPVGRFCSLGACTGEQRSCPAGGGRGCGLVEITGGTFTMGDASLPEYVYASPIQPMITVSDFAVDAYEVTVARFRRFWDAGHPNMPSVIDYPGEDDWNRIDTDHVVEPDPSRSGENSCTWTPSVEGAELFPLNCVSLATAQSFCAWDGGRLPTEAEWEYLARARPVEGLPADRRFPWGNDDHGAECVVAQFGSRCPGEADSRYPFRYVGSYPAIGGVYDLAGNVSELTASRFVEYWLPAFWGGVPRTDPFVRARSDSWGELVYRGGRYQEFDINRMYSAARSRLPGHQVAPGIGFRCVRNRRHA
jgi:sulfatase modifying factor 1